MPSNNVLINNSMEFIVVDSKMEDFLSWLRHNGKEITLKKESNEPIFFPIAGVNHKGR